MDHFQIRLFKPGFNRFGCVYMNVLIEDHSSSGRSHLIVAKRINFMVRKNKKSHDRFPHFRGESPSWLYSIIYLNAKLDPHIKAVFKLFQWLIARPGLLSPDEYN
jgi:hypothetical protein